MNKKFSLEETRELLRRYRLGQCTESELEIIDRWYQSFEADNIDGIDLAGLENPDDLKMQMWETINNKIDLAQPGWSFAENQKPPVRKLSFFTFDTLRRVAAILLIGTALGIFFYKQPRHISGDAAGSTVAISGEPGDVRESDQPSTLYLSDGTVVWLKEGSRLEFPVTFQGNIREVSLTGEAFFDVAKDPDKPFVIHSANFTTRVLGTSFNIKAYGNDDSQEVVVVTGKVVVSVNDPSFHKVRELVLHPNQKAVYSKKDNSLVESAAADPAKSIATDKHRLLFDETSLQDIIKVLNATYDVNISVSADNMNRCRITADLRNETLEVDIEILSKAINATYTIAGNDIILRGNGCLLTDEKLTPKPTSQ